MTQYDNSKEVPAPCLWNSQHAEWLSALSKLDSVEFPGTSLGKPTKSIEMVELEGLPLVVFTVAPVNNPQTYFNFKDLFKVTLLWT